MDDPTARTARTGWVRPSSILIALGLLACGAPELPPPITAIPLDRSFVLVGAVDLAGAPVELVVRDGVIAAGPAGDLPRFDAGGATIVPAFVDAHVHLSYDPVAAAHAAGGIAVAIDLASPLAALASTDDPLLVLRAGPMITSVGGYPLDAWGSDGYGIECDDPVSCAARVDALVAAGAAVIKVPIEESGGLDDPSLAAIAERAHASHRLLVAHALGPSAVTRAVMAGVDVLAHTPVTPLDASTLASLRGRAVISTLAAFGSSAAIDNLRALREQGVDVVYGTDLGNTRTTGIDAHELALLAAAGLDTAAIVTAATATPARVFGLARHGSLAPEHAASFLLYRGSLEDPTALATPDLVVEDGVVVGGLSR